MSRSRRIFRTALWGAVVLVLVAHLAFGWTYSSRIIDDFFVPSPAMFDLGDTEYGYEKVSFRSDVGELEAVYLPAGGETWLIHIHDVNTTPGQPEPLFAALQTAGYPQMSINYRNDHAQPEDPTSYHQYGATEWEDVRGAVDFARENGAEEIVLAGYGAGSSHALSYAFRHNFDDIAGMILDSANIDLGQTVNEEVTEDSLPLLPLSTPVTVAWTGKFFAALRTGINWKSLDYIEKADQSLRVPVLAFHGTKDETVSHDQTVQLQEVQPLLVRAVLIEDAGHVESFNVDFDRYLSEVLAFLSSES